MIHLITPDYHGGVHDFTKLLAQELGWERARVWEVSSRSFNINATRNDTVFVQFSGYGYHKRGVPLWLLSECRRLRRRTQSLGIFFHELYASGPLSTSAFWLSSVQKYIAKNLVRNCDFWITSREGYSDWLRHYAEDIPHAMLPVFSTIGESGHFDAIRNARVVVFGSNEVRCRTYRAAGAKLFSWAAYQNLEVHDIGSLIADREISALLKAHNVIQHGRLSAEEICRFFRETQFGVVAYSNRFVAKSSIFAAYCTHGVCPILISKDYGASDGLLADKHYLPGIPDGMVTGSQARNIGHAAWDWYQPHRLEIHAKVVKELANSAGAGG